MNAWDDNKLQRVHQAAGSLQRLCRLGNAVQTFMDRVVEPRQEKLGQLALAWSQLLPPELDQHSCLGNLYRGTLRVLVDDATSLYELNLLQQQGLLNELRQLCPTVSVSSLRLVRGHWLPDDTKDPGARRARHPRRRLKVSYPAQEWQK